LPKVDKPCPPDTAEINIAIDFLQSAKRELQLLNAEERNQAGDPLGSAAAAKLDLQKAIEHTAKALGMVVHRG
jgi:hypothetical protein